jgi:hypothetical protein
MLLLKGGFEMQTRNLSLALTETEWSALCEDAGQELRNPKQHARYLIRRALGIAADEQNATRQVSNGGETKTQPKSSKVESLILA